MVVTTAGFAGSLLAGSIVQAPPAAANMGICAIQRQNLFGGTPTPPPPAPTADGVGYGYVYDADCAADPGDRVVADPAYQYNSTRNPNSVDHVDVGSYVVRFAGLGQPGGIAHVTAYGPDLAPAAPGEPPQTGQCKVASWRSNGPDQLVAVRCFTPSGQPVDRQFTASYTNMRAFSGYDYGYLFANNPTAASYTPDPSSQYSTNVDQPLNKVVRTGVGRYTVAMTGVVVNATYNSVLVSAAGITYDPATKRVVNGNVTCQVSGSYGSTATIGCYAGGKPADSQFTLTYVGKGNLFDAPNRPKSGGTSGALPSSYAWAAAGTTGTPQADWAFSTYGTGTMAQVYDPSTGITKVTMPPYTGWGDVQAVAHGDQAGYCGVVNWSDQAVEVQCWDGYGNISALPFNVFFTGRDW
ncbi:hypothetical protein GCM10009838_17470 [Catenulispora subtropica]|uniref:Ig-like domain-containing protein n=1 Tax=Catenulispora subtropica TaxID=450798 RepID=A0ABN2R0K4_9ACTN